MIVWILYYSSVMEDYLKLDNALKMIVWILYYSSIMEDYLKLDNALKMIVWILYYSSVMEDYLKMIVWILILLKCDGGLLKHFAVDHSKARTFREKYRLWEDWLSQRKS